MDIKDIVFASYTKVYEHKNVMYVVTWDLRYKLDFGKKLLISSKVVPEPNQGPYRHSPLVEIEIEGYPEFCDYVLAKQLLE